jgi:asparagine synthase (glutamine-hydrolysing)
MPGLALILAPGPAGNHEADLHRMVASMQHEQFYKVGTYSDAALGVHVGWVCHPGSHCDRLPLCSEDGNLMLFFYGEHRSANSGGNEESSDAHAVLRLFEKHGLDAVPLLNGWFHGVLFDRRRQQITVFNDRYGIQRLHVFEDSPGTLFATEAKALLMVRPQLRELDPRGLAEWFSCGCALGNQTLFRGISLLPPGSAWIFSADSTLNKKSYFSSSEWENQPALSSTEFSERLQETFPRVLGRYTNGAEPVAMSLTGGLDGRMIMAWARAPEGALPCYTFNSSYRDCADVRIARKVAAACGQPHQTISVGDEFLTQFPRLAEQTVHITDGAMDVSGAAELYVNRLAHQIAPVRLTGNYGSEILRRHVAFKPHPLAGEVLSPDFVPQLAAAANTYSEEAAGNQLSFIAFKQVPWHHYARLAVEQSQITLQSPFLDNDLVALAFQAPSEATTSLAPSLRLIAQGNPLLGRIPTDRGVSYPATGITNRLHRSVEEFLTKAEYAYDYGMPNWLARIDHLLQPLRLERLFLGRQKFSHFRTWYRDALAPYVMEVLLDARSLSRPYLQKREVERMIARHVRGQGNSTRELHKLLSIELVQRLLIEGV